MSNGAARLREWWIRLRNSISGNRSDTDLREEVHAHLELAAGAPRTPGDVERTVEAMRDQRAFPFVEHLSRDLRYSWRSLARSPWFAAVAITTLVIGIGANTAIFAIINAVVLQPLPYPEPERLLYLSTRIPALGYADFGASPPEYFEFRELNRSFSGVGAYRPTESSVVANGQPMRVRAVTVDDHLLNVLALVPASGRLMTAAEVLPKARPVVMVSHGFWQAALGGGAVVGTSIEVDGVSREIVGVMQPGADVLDSGAELWLPLGVDPANRANRAQHGLLLIGRLATGVTQDAAQRELDHLLQNWGPLTGVKGTGVAGHVFAPIGSPLPPSVATPGHVLQMRDAKSRVVGTASQSLWIMQASVALLLVIVCVNLSGLFLARAETRRRELAVRAALGASRTRLVQLFVLESLSLTLVGAVGGVLLAWSSLGVLPRFFPGSLPRAGQIAIDRPALAFAVVVAVLVMGLLSLMPLLTLRGWDLIAAIKHARGSGSASRARVRTVLVAAQVALAIIVTIGAGLLLRTVGNLEREDAGFRRTQMQTFAVTVSQSRYMQPSNRLAFYDNLLDRVRAIPGVQAVTAMSGLPLSRLLDARATDIDGYTPGPDDPPEVVDYYQYAMPGYFDTMGIPMVRGRAFIPSDAAGGPVTVINQTLANTFWPGRDPIGQRLRPCCAPDAPWITVIGVARDVKQENVNRSAASELYFHVPQTVRVAMPPATMNVVIRTALPASTISPMVAAAVRELDPAVPIVKYRTMDDVLGESIQRPRVLATLLSAFAGVALLLTALGVYGLVAYAVAERRLEFGVRRALGATRLHTVALVARQITHVALAGAIVGLAAAAALNQALPGVLFGVQPVDPPTFAVAVLLIVLLAGLACIVPAWRALSIDPQTVLRDN